MNGGYVLVNMENFRISVEETLNFKGVFNKLKNAINTHKLVLLENLVVENYHMGVVPVYYEKTIIDTISLRINHEDFRGTINVYPNDNIEASED